MIANVQVRDAIFKYMKCDSVSTTMLCKKCGGKHTGKVFIDYRKPVKDVNGKDAFPVFWMCNNDWHHFFKKGYTGPVDFGQGYEDSVASDKQMPDDSASEKDWEDWARQTQERLERARA